MGSDLYMEHQNWKPRPNKAQWELVDGHLELVIYRDVFYHGYEMIWHGEVTDSNESLILAMVSDIPDKPEIPKPKAIQVRDALKRYYDYADPEIVKEVMLIMETEDPEIPVMGVKE